MKEKIGKLIVIVAPSGTGKSSLMRRLKEEDLLLMNLSHTPLAQFALGRQMGKIIFLSPKMSLKK